MTELCEIYYEPIYQFVRHYLKNEEQASDLTHAFFEQLLKENSIGSPDPAKGRFRSYLLGAAKHFLRDQIAKQNAKRRGGGLEPAPLYEELVEPIDNDYDYRKFDQDWAYAVITQAYQSVSHNMSRAGKERQFEILSPWLDGGQNGDSFQAASELGLGANAFKVAVHRLREKFRNAVRDEIRGTTCKENEVEEEFSYLIKVLSTEE